MVDIEKLEDRPSAGPGCRCSALATPGGSVTLSSDYAQCWKENRREPDRIIADHGNFPCKRLQAGRYILVTTLDNQSLWRNES